MTIRIKKFLSRMPKMDDPLLIEGLPGIGNVGKIAVDFMVDELKAKKLMEIRSHSFPHSVFIDENNLVELPTCELYYKKISTKKGKRDVLFLVGDIQPIDEEASYEFSHKILDILEDFKGKELITIGGIGLPSAPDNPKVFCTGTSKDAVAKFKKGTDVNEKLFGFIGPIVGVTGLLVGLAKDKNMDGVCLLAETYGHPLHLGVKGSKEIIKIMNKKLSMNLKVDQLDKEIKEIEDELTKKTEELSKISKIKPGGAERVNYIG